MNTKHTKAPWKVELLKCSNAGNPYTSAFAIRAEGKLRALVTADCSDGSGKVMVIHPEWAKNHPQSAEFYSPEEMEANAALIAAAPEMLEALELLLAGAEASQACGLNNPQVNGGVILAKAAIAKATAAK